MRKTVRRTQWLVNRGFQLRYMGIFVLAALVASLVIGGLLYAVVELNWVLQVEKGLNVFEETHALLSQQRNVVLGTFAVLFVLMAATLSLWGLFLSHRVAGPVYALARRMSLLVEEHDLVTPLRLRKKDALQDAKDFFNATLERLSSQFKNEVQVLDGAQREITDLVSRHPQYEKEIQSINHQIEYLIKGKEKWYLRNHS